MARLKVLTHHGLIWSKYELRLEDYNGWVAYIGDPPVGPSDWLRRRRLIPPASAPPPAEAG